MTLQVPTPGTGGDELAKQVLRNIKNKKENKWFKVNKKRRNRGYSFEHKLVIDINKMPDWHARRLGGSSTGLPDIVAVNNKLSQLYAIEAKSIMDGTKLQVPKHEVQRCIDIANMFEIYQDHWVMFSFKFSHSATKKVIVYHFIMGSLCPHHMMDKFTKLECTILGKCNIYFDNFPNQLTPFHWPFDK